MKSLPFPLTTILCAVLLPVCSALATPFAVPKDTLQPPQVTFSEVANFTPLNGLLINGFTFTESIPMVFTSPPGSGPGDTNNNSGDTALSGLGSIPAGYILTVSLATPSLSFGFGFALQGVTTVANAVTVTLFDGATNLGSLVVAGALDPAFTGGFVGVGNDAFFNSVQITFNDSFSAFAVDNFSSVIPEPSTVSLLAGAGLAALFFRRGRAKAAKSQARKYGKKP